MEDYQPRPSALVSLLLVLSGIGALFEAYLCYISPPKVIRPESAQFASPISETVCCLLLFLCAAMLLIHNFYPRQRLWPTITYALLTVQCIPLVFKALEDLYIYRTAFCTPDSGSDFRMALELFLAGATVAGCLFLTVTAFLQRPFPVIVTVLAGLWGLVYLAALSVTICTDANRHQLFLHWEEWLTGAARLCFPASMVLLCRRQKAADIKPD